MMGREGNNSDGRRQNSRESLCELLSRFWALICSSPYSLCARFFLMSLLKNFLFCISLENGAYIMAAYITLVNSCYIAALMMILNSYNVLTESMSGSEKMEMLGVASCVNFLCYYLFGSLLLVIAVNERQSQATSYFLMVHGSMTVFNLLCGLLFSSIFESLELLAFILFDTVFRAYGFFSVMNLAAKFRNEEHEANLVKFTEFVNLLNSGGSFSESQRQSYCEAYENGVKPKRESNVITA